MTDLDKSTALDVNLPSLLTSDLTSDPAPADDDSMLDWTVRHGRSAALYVALKSAPDQVLTEDWTKKTVRVIVGYLQVG